MVTVISLGGSIVAPNVPDAAFLRSFRDHVVEALAPRSDYRVILIVGGGAAARSYQTALREIGGATSDDLDWIGIMATRLNAELVRATFGTLCTDPVVYDPTGDFAFTGRVLVAAGWKPGFSTDYDAVMLADRFKARRVVNLSNIAKVYTADPNIDATAQPIDSISWADFRAMVGDSWEPGKNLPFDPIASRAAEKLQLSVICAAGRDLVNLDHLLRGEAFFGTTIGV